jgi:hypothetical protein
LSEINFCHVLKFIYLKFKSQIQNLRNKI